MERDRVRVGILLFYGDGIKASTHSPQPLPRFRLYFAPSSLSLSLTLYLSLSLSPHLSVVFATSFCICHSLVLLIFSPSFSLVFHWADSTSLLNSALYYPPLTLSIATLPFPLFLSFIFLPHSQLFLMTSLLLSLLLSLRRSKLISKN